MEGRKRKEGSKGEGRELRENGIGGKRVECRAGRKLHDKEEGVGITRRE